VYDVSSSAFTVFYFGMWDVQNPSCTSFRSWGGSTRFTLMHLRGPRSGCFRPFLQRKLQQAVTSGHVTLHIAVAAKYLRLRYCDSMLHVSTRTLYYHITIEIHMHRRPICVGEGRVISNTWFKHWLCMTFSTAVSILSHVSARQADIICTRWLDAHRADDHLT